MTIHNPDEHLADWLAAVRVGDDAAAEAIYRHYSPAVFRLAISLLNDADDADEVMQDTFVYALRNLRRYDPARAAFQTWLFTIAISRCRNKRRRLRLATVSLGWFAKEETKLPGDSVRSLEDWLAARGVRRELWLAVQELSPNLREALLLRFVGGLRYAEIGEAAGCGEKAAESRVRTAIVALQQRLAAQGETGQEWLETLAESVE